VDRPLNLPAEAGDRPDGTLPPPGHVLGHPAELLVGSPDLGGGLGPLGLVDLVGRVRHHDELPVRRWRLRSECFGIYDRI
jgi:hypothetical protein